MKKVKKEGRQKLTSQVRAPSLKIEEKKNNISELEVRKEMIRIRKHCHLIRKKNTLSFVRHVGRKYLELSNVITL